MPQNLTQADQIAIRASWVLPVDQPPIRDGVVVIDLGNFRIAKVAPFSELPSSDSVPTTDLGNVSVIPGLVNAHTHLEFSDLNQPLGHPGIEFTEWIKLIVAHRESANEVADSKQVAIQHGLVASLNSGGWAVGDIATAPANVSDYSIQTLPKDFAHFYRTVFLEQLGRDSKQFTAHKEAMSTFHENFERANDRQLQPACSPHAPYSTHPALVQQLCDSAKKQRLPVAMHLAETSAERQLLESRTGPFVDLLKSFGVWDPNSFSPDDSILNLLHTLSQAPRSLVVHGNYLNEQELDFIAAQEGRMSVVFCPRTHHFFQHRPYPLRAMLDRGINVALGTDSLASNPDLQLIREVTHVHATMPNVRPDRLLWMATLGGARALGIDTDYGSITPGKFAAISAVMPESSARQTPFSWMASPTPTCYPVSAAGPTPPKPSNSSVTRTKNAGRHH